MPRNTLEALPFPPLKVIDQNAPVDATQLRAFLDTKTDTDGVSILIRSETGHPERGGYFFHFRRSTATPIEYELFDFQKTRVAAMTEDELILLINHCSGRQYSEASYLVCQNEINLRSDQ